jgi:hypothetical protein
MNLFEVGDKHAHPIALPVDSSRAIMQQYAVMSNMQVLDKCSQNCCYVTSSFDTICCILHYPTKLAVHPFLIAGRRLSLKSCISIRDSFLINYTDIFPIILGSFMKCELHYFRNVSIRLKGSKTTTQCDWWQAPVVWNTCKSISYTKDVTLSTVQYSYVIAV